MNLWLIAGIVPPLLFAIVNHIDKHLLSRSIHPSSVNVLMVYSTGFSAFLLPIIFLIGHQELLVDWQQIVIQIIGGLLMSFSIYFYLQALFKEEASKVMPLALLAPVFGYLFSYFILHEVLTLKEFIGCALIIFGAIIISLEFREESGRLGLKHGILLLMIGCAAFQALQETLFKFATIENSFIVSVFWQHVGILIYGIVLLLIHKGLWKDFKKSVDTDGVGMFGFNFFSEGISSLAYIIKDFALLLAPVTIIMTLGGYQPAFVFILGIILTLLLPKISTEKITAAHLLHKGLAIAVMIVGTLLIGKVL
jgi:transporter family protein